MKIFIFLFFRPIFVLNHFACVCVLKLVHHDKISFSFVHCSFEVNDCVVPVIELVGHEDVVQAVVFDPSSKYLVSGSTDCTFKVWA